MLLSWSEWAVVKKYWFGNRFRVLAGFAPVNAYPSPANSILSYRTMLLGTLQTEKLIAEEREWKKLKAVEHGPERTDFKVWLNTN